MPGPERAARDGGTRRFHTTMIEPYDDAGSAAIRARILDLFEDVKKEYGTSGLFSDRDQITRPDVTQFTAVVEELIVRYQHLAGDLDTLTLVYDAGQNSATNHAQIEASGIGFVGSLPPSDHSALLAVPGRGTALSTPIGLAA